VKPLEAGLQRADANSPYGRPDLAYGTSGPLDDSNAHCRWCGARAGDEPKRRVNEDL